MTRRSEFQRRPRARRAAAAVAAVVVVVGFPGAVAVAEDDILITPDEIIVAEPGAVINVASEAVPAELVGASCDLRVTAENGASVHPGNDLVATTGETRTVVAGVEDAPDGSVVDVHRVTLGEQIVIDLVMGPDGVSSLGFTLGFDCPPVEMPTVESDLQTPTSLPPVTEAPSPTVLPAKQEAPTLPAAPPANATVGAPAYTG